MSDNQWLYLKVSLGAIRGSLGTIIFLLMVLIVVVVVK